MSAQPAPQPDALSDQPVPASHPLRPDRAPSGVARRASGRTRDRLRSGRVEDPGDIAFLRRALLEAEARYDAVVDLSSDAIVVHQDGRIVLANRSAARLLGAEDRRTLVGMDPIAILHPDDRARVRGRIARLVTTGGTVPVQAVRIIRLDGQTIDVEITGVAVSFEGRPAVETIVRDIRERKLAEAALHESEAETRSLLEAAPVAVWSVSGAGIVTRAAGNGLLALGASADELVGQNALDLTVRIPALHDALRRGLSGEASTLVVNLRRGAIDCRLTPIRRGGEVTGLIGVVTDVSAREEAEAARRETEARIRAIFDESSIGMLLLDPTGRFIATNGALGRLLGYDEVELAARSIRDITHHDDLELTGGAMRDFFAGRTGAFEMEKRYVRKDGTVLSAHLHISPVCDDDGRVRYAATIMEDISARTVLEEQLHQASKMEALGRLAGGVAHDFNNLLTVVNGYADLLASSLEGDERAADAIEIRRAGARASELTRQLLAFGRRQKRELQAVDFNARIGLLLPMLRRIVGEDIQLIVDLSSRVGAVEADPSQLDQVVMNLVVNARDAMPDGGTVSISTTETRDVEPVDASSNWVGRKRWVKLEIADTGQGMAPDVVAHIFEPFFTTKAPGEGTGLGLATVYGIVQQAGGHIDVESSTGAGTTFRVLLPLTDHEEAVPGTRGDVGPGSGNETVLLVEDDAGVRSFCHRSLQAAGYRVVACGPEDALARAATLGRRLDLLLTDVVMPGLDGPGLARALSEAHPGLAVVLMSGYPRDESAAAAGQPAILAKPFTHQELCGAVRRALDRNRPES